MTKAEYVEEVVEKLIKLGDLPRERAKELVEDHDETVTANFEDGAGATHTAEAILDVESD